MREMVLLLRERERMRWLEGKREAREGEREWCERKREYFGAREALEEEADCCV